MTGSRVNLTRGLAAASRTASRVPGTNARDVCLLSLLCLLATVGFCHSGEASLPSRHEIESSINRTVEEVERMVREDPSLPRLSREEIVQILRNITSKDLEAYRDKEAMEKTREMYHRALMVVLPYNANDTSHSLKDLYSMPPVTRIVPDSNTQRMETSSGNNREDQLMYSKDSADKRAMENTVVTHSFEKSQHKVTATTSKSKYKNHRETYSDVRTRPSFKDAPKTEAAPVKFTFDLENLRKAAQSTERIATMRNPVFQESKSPSGDLQASAQKLEIVYSTVTTTESAMRVESTEIAIDAKKPEAGGSKSQQNVLSSDQWRYNAPPSPSEANDSHFRSTMIFSLEDAISVDATKTPMASGTAKETTSERPSPVYVTPMTSTTSEKSKLNLASGGFRVETTTRVATVAPMRPEVMGLLAAIGLSRDNETNVEDVYKKNKEVVETRSQIPDTSDVLRSTTSGLTSVDLDSPSITGQNTFEGPATDYRKGVDNLTRDVQLLFQRFGLQTSLRSDLTTSTTTVRPTANANSYTNFKPLPAGSGIKDQGMREFLAKFGLGLGENRSQKALNARTERPSVIEAVPAHMRRILENIGLISSTQKPSRIIEQTAKNGDKDMQSTDTVNYHVFKPHEVSFKDERQRSKINELLDTVKMVQQGKADARDVQRIANDLLQTAKTLGEGPDPLSLEEIIRIYNDDARNEVKRQQSGAEADSAASNATSSTSDSSSSKGSSADGEQEASLGDSTTKPEADSANATSDQRSTSGEDTSTPGPGESSTSSSILTDSATLEPLAVPASTSSNLVALEESFGGTTRAPDPVLPTKRRSGLYFLVDWNTFLEVGDEDTGGKVNLRFQPKVGDRTRFLPVTIP